MISVKKKRLLTRNTKIDKRGPMVKKAIGLFMSAFHVWIEEISPASGRARGLCGPGAYIPSRVSVNVATNEKLARKIIRSSQRRVLFSVPLPVKRSSWQHLHLLGAGIP